MRWTGVPVLIVSFVSFVDATELDDVLRKENERQKVALQAAPVIDDLAFLRRATMDLIGRVPTLTEIEEYQAWPANERRLKVVDKLIEHDRFADRWTAFYSDMLRLRSNAEGGSPLIAYVHQAIEDDLPYDELARRLISTNGRAGRTPEVGFVLGDNADPLALASATAQIFMGVRMGCAQCHDHPFDTWTQKDFYGLAAFYGKTRRITSRLSNVSYTTEVQQSSVLWPPAGDDDADRIPITPEFPIALAREDRPSQYIARLKELRDRQAAKRNGDPSAQDIDDLLAETDDKIKAVGKGQRDVDNEARAALRKINLQAALYKPSELRAQLADFVASPRNRYFSRSFVNRVWAELVGRGFVNPVDDFSADNRPSHNDTLDYLADEFVASGYSFKNLVRAIVTSDAYRRSHVGGEDLERQREMEESFLATPMRRVLSEALYDSIVTAGHLFEVKHKPGQNERVVFSTVRVRVDSKGEPEEVADPATEGLAQLAPRGESMPARMMQPSGYDLENTIELDFDAVLKAAKEEVALEEMRVMSTEELEAMRMQQRAASMPRGTYVEKTVKRVYDDNPRFGSAFRMASPAPPAHFLRVFGQPGRSQLGEGRDQTPSMRQALMMLNGRVTHEASRVGELEPIHELIAGPSADISNAVALAYLEILTRIPTDEELSEAKEIVDGGQTALQGMADLRWVLLNCNEFRYLR